jgi:hypothetical protein
MDPQIGAYLQAARQMGLDVMGVCYDAMAKPALRPQEATPVELRKYTKPTKKDPESRLYANQRDRDETSQEFEQRCLDAIAEDPASYYQRQICVRFENEHRESGADFWQTSQNIRDARRLSIFPRNPDSCIQWSRECEFLRVCAGQAEITDPVLFYKESREHEELELVEDERVRLTQSSVRCFRSCPRKYQYRYVMGVRSQKKFEPLRMGGSLHKAIETLRLGKGLDAALAALDATNSFSNAKERAMIRGYYARWGEPRGIVAVEKQFEIDLVNPHTGASSRTFWLAGKFDGVYEGDEKGLLDPWGSP